MSTTLLGCSADGRPRIITKSGSPAIREPAADLGLYSQFQVAAANAYPIRKDGSVPTPDQQRYYLRSGFALIRTRCNAYIEGKTDRQRTLNTWRDLFTPVIALASGLIALDNDGDDVDGDYIKALTVVTTGATAGFRIYEQRYLFGSENVEKVRRLVLDALELHEAEALKIPKENVDYSQATLLLLENQMICSPGSILELVSKSIDRGQPVVAPTPTPGPPALPAGAATPTTTPTPASGPAPAPPPPTSSAPPAPVLTPSPVPTTAPGSQDAPLRSIRIDVQ